MRLFWRLTGGRPMTFVSESFVDNIAHEKVGLYRDQFGRHWLSVSPWALFRVRWY